MMLSFVNTFCECQMNSFIVLLISCHHYNLVNGRSYSFECTFGNIYQQGGISYLVNSSFAIAVFTHCKMQLFCCFFIFTTCFVWVGGSHLVQIFSFTLLRKAAFALGRPA